MTRQEAIKLREAIEQGSVSLPDEMAVNTPTLFPPWKPGTVYSADMRVYHIDTLYRCLQTHESQTGWEPTVAPSLWAKVLIVDPATIPEWEQPESTNPYMIGDKVTHNGKSWESTVDNNVWEPGVYGWSEV